MQILIIDHEQIDCMEFVIKYNSLKGEKKP